MRILSIDFDFFQNTDKETIETCYPDGIDYSTSMSSVIWANHYAKYNKLNKVSIDKYLYLEILEIITKQHKYIPICVAQSHVCIYKFIEELKKVNPEEILKIVNIDLHHDVCNDNEELDCGNWISHIVETYPGTQIGWIARDTSLDIFDLTKEEILDIGIETNFKKIKNIQFDAIFICRSDMWLPPHLDEYFDKLILKCKLDFKNIYIENCVSKPRNLNKINKVKNKIIELREE